jgi:hypothetical protein
LLSVITERKKKTVPPPTKFAHKTWGPVNQLLPEPPSPTRIFLSRTET